MDLHLETDVLQMSVYEHIQRLAKTKKISIRQIEIDLGFSNGSLRKWKNSAPSDKLMQVAKYLGTTPDYLILGKNDESNKKKTPTKVDVKAAIDDDDVLMTFDGKPIPPEDLALIKRLLEK